MCTRKHKEPPPARDSKEMSCDPRRTCLVMARLNGSFPFFGDLDGTVSSDVLSRLAKGDRVDVRFMGTDCRFVVDQVCLDIGIVYLLWDKDGNRVMCDLRQIHMVHPAKMTEWHFQQLDTAMGCLGRVPTKTVRLNAEIRREFEIKFKNCGPLPDIEERLDRRIDDLVKREFQRGKTYGKIATFIQSFSRCVNGIVNDGCVLYTPPHDLKRAIHVRWMVRALRTGKYIDVDEIAMSKIRTDLKRNPERNTKEQKGPTRVTEEREEQRIAAERERAERQAAALAEQELAHRIEAENRELAAQRAARRRGVQPALVVHEPPAVEVAMPEEPKLNRRLRRAQEKAAEKLGKDRKRAEALQKEHDAAFLREVAPAMAVGLGDSEFLETAVNDAERAALAVRNIGAAKANKKAAKADRRVDNRVAPGVVQQLFLGEV